LELHKAKKWSEAFAYCQQAIELYPNHAKALELSARLYGLTQQPADPAQKLGYLRRALTADPLLYNANLWLAINLAESGRWEEARQAFQMAIQIIPIPDIAATALARALSEWGFNQEADSLFKKLMARKSLDPAVLSDYAWHLMRRHDEPTEIELHQAAELLRKAVKMEPRNWHHHYSLAVALLDFEPEREEAIQHARVAIKLRPESKQAQKLLAELTASEA
jgi:tetratricopeptide (TPR) repeat protein